MLRFSSSRLLRRHRDALLATALVAVVPFGLAFPDGSQAVTFKTPSCKKPAHVISSKYGNYLFRKGSSLWACTAYYGDPPKTRRLGPWSQGFSRVHFDGSTAVWTVAGPKFEGVPVDRVWVADAPRGHAWIKGLRPVPGKQLDDTDSHVAALHATGDAAGWVTGGGAVVMTVQDPQSSDATPLGLGTPAAAPAPVLGIAQGLSDPLAARGHRLLVGRWMGVSPETIGATMSITAGEGDGDECGGAGPWSLTVRPLSGQPRVGATWDSDWTSSSDACTS
ncbi:MAG: hypothetical protein J7513_15415 [Solirubrobacteraceae bacterium]|nr:hypothetical protein [Solirubrobacteraceae bacterium]